MKFAVFASAAVLALAACTTLPVTPPEPAGTFVVRSAEGQSMGRIVLVPSGTGYALQGSLNGLSPGLHGIHLHMAGRCEGPSFTTAGAHLNPASTEHGTMNPKGPHLGDFPNVSADASGRAYFSANLATSRSDLDRHLFDGDGTALVIHAAADDYRTDPSGNSGARIGCATLMRGSG